MITVRQIERLWSAKAYHKLLGQLLAMRVEDCPDLHLRLTGPASVAALAVVRLEELNQPHVPICRDFIRYILSQQEADGGWGDLLTTALCLRALMCCDGHGLAIDRGIAYLAALQRSDGLWPVIPIRRTASDPFVSAFILYQLGGDGRFGERVGMEAAWEWLAAHAGELDADTARLWKAAVLRGRIHRRAAPTNAAA